MKRFLKKWVALILCVTLFVGLQTTVSFAVESDSDIVLDNASQRVVVKENGDTVYRSVYDKTTQIVTCYVMVNQVTVDVISMDIGEMIEQASEESHVAATASVASTTLSWTTHFGFAYAVGDYYSTYSCSDQMIANGIVNERLMQVYNYQRPDLHTALRNAIFELHQRELDLDELVDDTVSSLVIDMIIALFTNPADVVGSMVEAAVGVVGIDDITMEVYEMGKECQRYYLNLEPYKM